MCLATDDMAKQVEVIDDTKKVQHKAGETGRGSCDWQRFLAFTLVDAEFMSAFESLDSMTPNIAMTTFEHVMEGRKNITKYQAAEVPKLYLQVSAKTRCAGR